MEMTLLFPSFLFVFNQIHAVIHLFNKYLLSAFPYARHEAEEHR